MRILVFLLILSSFFYGKTRIIVHLEDALRDVKRGRPDKVLQEIRRKRGELIDDFLKENKDLQFENLRKFWIFPGFITETDSVTISVLQDRKGVKKVVKDFKVPFLISSKNSFTYENSPFWHVRSVRADSAWSLGYKGSGIIIGLIDTGFDPDHPLIKGKWHPYYGFFDAVSYALNPYDDHGHGTYTTALAVGDSCGIAPGAQFLMAKAFSPDGGYASDIHECFEWFASLADSGALPDIISGSFGMPFDPENNEFFEDMWTLQAVGVISIFSIGNEGPSSYTANPPGNYPIAIGVGACDSLDFVASFSSRGPAPFISPWSDTLYWPSPDWDYYKPDIIAPGVDVTSAFPGNQYKEWSGTSAAAPIVAGGIAILKEKNLSLQFNEIFEILRESARKPSHGSPYPNNSYGYGIFDVVNALSETPEDTLAHFVIRGASYLDMDGDGSIEPMETVFLSLIFYNNGNQSDSTTFQIIYLPWYISVLESETTVYSIERGDTIEINFTLSFNGSTPHGDYFYIILSVESPGREQSFLLKHHTGVTAEDFYTHSTDSIRLSVTRHGSIGFTNSERRKGVGFHFPKDAVNALFYGSFSVANSPDYVVDRFFESNATDDMDWLPQTPIIRPDTLLSDDDVYSIYNDDGFPLPKGIEVKQTSLSFRDRNFVILIYEISNHGESTIDNLYCGVFLDWDIGDPTNNTGRVESIERMVYLTEPASFYYGISLIEPPLDIGNLSLIPHEEYVYPFGGLPDSLQWLFLNGSLSLSEAPLPSDYSVVASAGPFSFNPEENRTIVFAIFAARTPAHLKATADSAEWIYRKVTEGRGYLANGPQTYLRFSKGNVLRKGVPLTIDFNFPTTGKIVLKLFDISGRRISEGVINIETPERGTLQWVPEVYSSGIYFLLIEGNGKRKKAPVIIFR